MYKVVKIRENDLPTFRGKIIQVISREDEKVLGVHTRWVLVCLVEESQNECRRQKSVLRD